MFSSLFLPRNLVAVSALVLTFVAHAGPLSNDAFNVFVFGDFSSQNSSSEGSIVAGGDFSVKSYNVNSQRVEETGLVVGGSARLTNGQVQGDVWTGSGFVAQNAGVHGSVYQDPAALRQLSEWEQGYKLLSTSLGALQTTGVATRSPWGGLTLAGDGSAERQVFLLLGSELKGLNQFTFSGIEDGAEVVLNIAGDASLSNMDSSTLGRFSVLLNFIDATEVSLSQTSPWADILAPYAEIKGSKGFLHGTLVADSFDGTMAFREGSSGL